MLRSELISAIAEQNPGLTLADAERVVHAVLDTVAVQLADGGRVELRGFGSFSVRERGAWMGRNPKNGEAVAVKATSAIHFRTGKTLRDRLNAK